MSEFVHIVVAQSGGSADLYSTILMFGAMFAIIYFMMIRPQRKQQQEHQALLGALKKGDEVVLTSGIYGKVWAVEDKNIVVEIAEKTRVKALKSSVSSLVARADPRKPTAPGPPEAITSPRRAPTKPSASSQLASSNPEARRTKGERKRRGDTDTSCACHPFAQRRPRDTG